MFPLLERVKRVTIPPNTTVTIYVPAGPAGEVTESGKPIASARSVVFTDGGG